MNGSLVLLTVSALVGLTLAKQAWNVGAYPDPINYPAACGREGPSFVCDPDNLLPVEKVNLVDGLLKAIYNETNSGCYSVNPERRGWLVMMAVVPKMDKYFTKNLPDSMQVRFREAVTFSWVLSTPAKWGNHSNNCDEMAVIIYAVQDKVLFTMTRSRIKEVLTDNVMAGITWDAITRYGFISRSPRRAADAVTYMVRAYRELLKSPRASG